MAAVDAHNTLRDELSSPASHAAEVTPDNDNELDYITRGVYVGTTGNLRVKMAGGETVTIPTIPAGTTLAIRVIQIYATLTTASGIVAFW